MKRGLQILTLTLSLAASTTACSSDEYPASYADVEIYPGAIEAIQRAVVIVIGTPREPDPPEVLSDNRTADYRQVIDVESVLFGSADSTVQVIRAGDVTQDSGDEGLSGPLPQQRLVLFLQDGGDPETYSVVGHFQGAIDFSSGRIQDSPWLEIEGMDKQELRDYVKTHSRPGERGDGQT